APLPAWVAAGSETTMVSPPPGVYSGSTAPPIASVSPRETASPSPTPVVLLVSPSRRKGMNARSLSASGMPGPQSITGSSPWSPRALAVSWRGGPDRGVPERVADQVHDDPFHDRRIGHDL